MKYINVLCCICAILVTISCSQSGRRKASSIDNQERISPQKELRSPKWNGKTTVNMEKKDGVYQIPIDVNGVRMYFILDTGAGMVSISETEAIFLYKQGLLSRDDIVGTANFTDANGDISEGTIINLKTIKIGNRTLNNVQASIAHNLNAPLLLGQTVLEKFGNITIDNERNKIILE